VWRLQPRLPARHDAALESHLPLDEDDYSAGTLNFYVDFFKSIKGFRNEGCCTPTPSWARTDQGNARRPA
jgi:hypothetical protein